MGSLGAWTAAEQGAIFFENVVNESSANPRMMIVHEVMGRDCGWLTAATAKKYRERLSKRQLLPAIGLSKERLDVHAVFLPEVPVDFEAEAKRLRAVLDAHDNVNIFIKGHKPFDIKQEWFNTMLEEIGQGAASTEAYPVSS